MLLVISPAKTLDFDTPPSTARYSQPAFLAQAHTLIAQLRQLAPQDIAGLMAISDKLGVLNYDRFARWQTPFHPGNAKQALLAFKGDVYTGLAAEQFNEADFAFAQQHLRILSGLYGLLRPLDLIQPYRLEMGTRFANSAGRDLYQFWGEQLTDALNAELAEHAGTALVNLASNEYFKAVQPRRLHVPVITPVFKDLKNGRYKIISFYAKKARGMMSAYAIRERLQTPEGLKAFTGGGYRYQPEQSTASEWVYTRDGDN